MRSQRLLSILMQLQVHRRMTARDLARKLEVSERTILRDMEALSGSGVPVVAERGAGGGWGLLAEYETKLTGLSPEEIQSLFVSRTPKLAADLGLQQAAEGAWTKLQAALTPSARRQADFVRQRVLIDTRGWRNAAESAALAGSSESAAIAIAARSRNGSRLVTHPETRRPSHRTTSARSLRAT